MMYYIYIIMLIYSKENLESFTCYEYFIEWEAVHEQRNLLMKIRDVYKK